MTWFQRSKQAKHIFARLSKIQNVAAHLQKLATANLVVLDEANILGPLPEALTAHVDAILADDGRGVVAYPASPGT